jgi:hypothetical protein
LDAVQSREVEERITFVPLGTAEDGYTHSIVKIKENGNQNSKKDRVISLRFGKVRKPVYCLGVIIPFFVPLCSFVSLRVPL